MGKKKKNQDELNENKIDNSKKVLEKEEISLDNIEPELEETESYQKASFAERLSLKFRKRLITNKIHTIILIIFLLVVIWGINIWADSKNLAQIDVTKNQLYSLTNTSKDQLKSLDKDILMYVYGYTKTDDLVQFLAQYNAFNSKIKYEIISESTNYDLVTKYSLGTSSAIVVTCGDKDRTIYPEYEFSTYDSDSGDSINLAEEVITNAILKVSTDDSVKVYFATGNSEYSKDELYYLTTYLEEEVYEVEEVNLLTVTEIPTDCDILAILGPGEDITESQAEIIKNYANNGGNLLVSAVSPKEGDFTNLQKVLDLYGVTIEKGLLYEGDSSHYLAYQNSSPLPYILIPGYSSSNPITSDFSNSNQMIIMPSAQSLKISDVVEENVSVTNSEIISTSSKCYNIEDYTKGITSATLKDLEQSTYTIGSELTRKIKSGENEIESKLVIFANDTFYMDKYQDANVQVATMSNAGNINLIMNTFAELGEEENLITVRKAANVTEFKNTESQARIVKLIIFGIPVVIIAMGVIIWNHRRHKR